MKYYGLDWVGTVLGLMSIYYLGRKRKIGFVFRIVESIFWVAFGIVAGTTAGIVANVAVILLSVSGLKQWRTRTSDEQ
jgi:nicotinamide riboside transporter PnuC